MSKYWKEAASVIVVAKSIFTKNGNSVSMCKKNIPIKNPANPISKTERDLKMYNYSVLALKRSSNNLYPDTYVFPGGNADSADSSKDWLELLKQNGVQESALDIFALSPKESNVNSFEPSKENEMLKSISLRITGIRETFEECGILLCKSTHVHPPNIHSKWASFLTGHEIQTWQKKVQENADEFINLCKHFECYPDIWSLKEWSNWLTPNNFPKRFNTKFFIAYLDQKPPTSCNSAEVTEFKWSSPQDIVDLCNRQDILLPPPQYYELSRLMTFTDIEQLADCKNTTSSDLWMPFRLKTADGEVTLLPGDDLYPAAPNYASGPTQKVEKTLEELREQSNSLHRMEHSKKCNTKLLIRNISLGENHIIPQVTSF